MLSRLVEPLNSDLQTVAAGIFDVLIAKTVGAIRAITVERGKDPREFSLLAFGGAGPMIAPMIAREVGAVEVIVPNVPAAFSAWGMLMSDLVLEVAQTDVLTSSQQDWPRVEAHLATLESQARALLAEQGVAEADRMIDRLVECRYVGQEHAIAVRLTPEMTAESVVQAFNEFHAARYGHAMKSTVQVSTLRVRATGRLPKPVLSRVKAAAAPAVPINSRAAYCFARRSFTTFHVYKRSALESGHQIAGPAIIDEGTSTTLLHSDQQLSVDQYGNLLICARAG
jgi:N-methylhydantoinase A